MDVKRHRLVDDAGNAVPYVASPNRSGRFAAGACRYVIIHYTAGGGANGTVSHFQRRAARCSAHLVIDRDGSITQMVPFDRIAWHAGRSQWHGLSGLNRHSIGIELCNWGPLRGHPGAWRTEVGGYAIDDALVEVAAHRNEHRERGWEVFPHAQVEAALAAAQALVFQYGLTDVLGHDDIAPARKIDPGPGFPMRWLRGKVVGRDSDAADIMTVTAHRLNIRVRPGIDQPTLPESPLSAGTRVQAAEAERRWFLVHVLDDAGEPTLTGWVHGDFVA